MRITGSELGGRTLQTREGKGTRPMNELQWLDEVCVLWQQQRHQCAWFVRLDFVPANTSEARLVLNALAKRGNRETYRRASELLRQMS